MKHMRARFPDEMPPLGHYVYYRRLICPVSLPWTCVWLPKYCCPNAVTAGVLPWMCCHAYRHSADNVLSSHAALLVHICPYSMPQRCRHCAYMVQPGLVVTSECCFMRTQKLAFLRRVSAARIPSFSVERHDCLSGRLLHIYDSLIKRSVQSTWYRKFQTRKTNQSSIYLPGKGKPALFSGERESWTPV